MITTYSVNILEENEIENMISEMRIQKIVQLSKLLDPVANKAALVVIRAMAEGFDTQTAMEMGNVVLTAASYDPILGNHGQIY